jgi:hypothetical protein
MLGRKYELELGRHDVDEAIAYLGRCSGAFFLDPVRSKEDETKLIKVYHGQANEPLFEIKQQEGESKVTVSGVSITSSMVKDVQQALSGQ